MHHYQDLISIFNSCFLELENTQLVKGCDEPIYLPADGTCAFHRIVFAHGYYASGLHEIAHWLVAGQARRLLEDYGYWYCPDGRDLAQQAEFEKVEVHPQAIEWVLSVAAGFDFNVSADNLNGVQTCRFAFQRKVYNKVNILLAEGFNHRTEILVKALCSFYNTEYPLKLEHFTWQDKALDEYAV